MIKIDIKPLSTNEAWQGRRFKTYKYKAFIRSMMLLLPNRKDVVKPTELRLKFGFSSPLADVDNPIKMTIDSLAQKYLFNDKSIKRLLIEAESTKKGSEFISFDFNIKNYVMTHLDIVKKLTGEIAPTGDVVVDAERLNSLVAFEELTREMVLELKKITGGNFSKLPTIKEFAWESERFLDKLSSEIEL